MKTIFIILVIIFSAVIHEFLHGFVANKLGDNTAKLLGRLTLNPIKHLDLFGSIILPLLLSLIPGGIIFGWAKPVPYNPLNLKNPEKGAAQIAAAGPLGNLLIAFIIGLIVRLFNLFPPSSFLLNLNSLLLIIVYINITLAIFNLMPIPPLDGSKVIKYFIPGKFYKFKFLFSDQNPMGIIAIMVFIFWGFSLIYPLIRFIFKVFTGTFLVSF